MSTSILKVLTELTALTPNGIVILKPFRPWFGIPLWRGRNIGIRVLNSHEIQQALEFINDVPTIAQDQALKKEIIVRSLWSVDGAYVASKEDLDEYNKLHSTTLTELEYKRIFVGAFEQHLLDYLYTVYTELQKKQLRKVYGLHMCAVCKEQMSKVPEDAYIIKFDVAEILCSNCFANVSKEDDFVFEKSVEFVKPTDTTTTSEQVIEDKVETPQTSQTSQIKTPGDFETRDEYRNYLIEQAEKRERDATQIQ